jgi:hypothetical protein
MSSGSPVTIRCPFSAAATTVALRASGNQIGTGGGGPHAHRLLDYSPIRALAAPAAEGPRGPVPAALTIGGEAPLPIPEWRIVVEIRGAGAGRTETDA